VVDWDLNFYADTSYFGLIGGASADTGQVMRFSLENDAEPGNWQLPETFFQSNLPVFSQPTPAIDDNNNKWVFFGSGRYFANADKISTTTQSLFGVKDDESGVPVLLDELLDVTDVEVYTDGSLGTPLSTLFGDPFGTQASLTTFDEIEDYMDEKDDTVHNGPMGWTLDLPPIEGVQGIDPATRNVTRSALLGGVLFSSVFQPSLDSCAGEGLSRLYGLYYKTGTAYPGPAIFGTETETSGSTLKYRSRKFVDLGIGFATAPAIHSGSGTGAAGVSVFTQLSTGDILRKQVETVDSVRTGKTSWIAR
jgi:type IV pilus assembly protein PilY1